MKYWFALVFLICYSFAGSQALAITDEKMEVTIFAEGNWEIRRLNDEFNVFQTNAITEYGAKLILYKDRTWKYANPKDREAFENILTRKEVFETPKSADSLVRSEYADAGVYFDKQKWNVYASDDLRYSEYDFVHSGKSKLYGYFKCLNSPKENIEVIKNEFIGYILNSPNISILKKAEYRIINGIKMFHMHYSKKLDDGNFDYIDNYFQTTYGYCHISGYTYSNQFTKNKEEIEKLINGISKAERLDRSDIPVELPPQSLRSN